MVQNWRSCGLLFLFVLLLSLTMVVSSYLVLQWFHLALLDRVGGMFFLGFICGCVNPEMITWQPISFGVRFLDDRCGSLLFEGFIVTDDAGYLIWSFMAAISKVLLLQTFPGSVVTTRKLLGCNCNLST